MTDRLGSRGGTLHSLEEAEAVLHAQKREMCELVRSAILDTLERFGTYTADDLHDYDLPEASANVIGAVTRDLTRKGLMRKTGWVVSTNPARHGAENRTYEITDAGRQALAGVGGTNREGSAGLVHCNRTLDRPGGASVAAKTSGARSARTVDPGDAKAPERTVDSAGVDDAPVEQLPGLGDVPIAQGGRPLWRDHDDPGMAA